MNGQGLVTLSLDEGSGVVALDSSGLGNNGALLGNPAYEADTGNGSAYALHLDGMDDWVDLGSLDVAGTGLTLAAWFKPESFPGRYRDPRLISKASGTSAGDHVFMLSTIASGNATRLRARVRVGGSTTTLVAGSGNLATGVWQHGAATYDGSVLRLYLNGVEVGSTALSGAVDVVPDLSVAVGSHPGGALRLFDGWLDDVRILERAMSQADLQALMGGNGAPVASNDNFLVDEDTVLVIGAFDGVLGNDSDPDGDPLQAMLVQDVSQGTLTLNADGSFDYTPNPGFSGTDSFTYLANDGSLDSNPATVVITIAMPPGFDDVVATTLAFAGQQVLDTVANLSSTSEFPRYTSASGQWSTVTASDWTSGFFPALLWKLYLATGDDQYLTAATGWSGSLDDQATRTDTHDVGFMVGLPAALAHQATGDTAYRDTLLAAAASLSSRFNPDVGATRSWDFGGWQFPVIIDNMMNLELLYDGAALTSVSADAARWTAEANSHAAVTSAEHLRPDGSSYHLVDFNPATGAVLSKQTHQGAGDETTWARGQAWGIYGFAKVARVTGDAARLTDARAMADDFLANLPADFVPYWDYDASGIPFEPRDTSAAAIAAAGLLELSTLIADTVDSAVYFDAAVAILDSLMSPTYLSDGLVSDGILLHGVGHLPANREIDVSLIYGDYYFVEALIRYQEIVGSWPGHLATR